MTGRGAYGRCASLDPSPIQLIDPMQFHTGTFYIIGGGGPCRLHTSTYLGTMSLIQKDPTCSQFTHVAPCRPTLSLYLNGGEDPFGKNYSNVTQGVTWDCIS